MSKNVVGYSLIELIIAISILSVLIVVSVPKFSLKTRRLRLQTERVVDYLRHLQTLSFYQSQRLRIQIHENRLELLDIDNPLTKQYKVLHLEDGIKITSSSHNRISFNSAGTGTASNITLSNGHSNCTVTNSIFNRLRYSC